MKLFLLLVLFQTIIYAKTSIVVSILPQKTFVEKIAQGMAHVTVMVSPGASPHTYEPKISQMIALSKADLYFSIGIEFEKVWLDKFKSQNNNLKFSNMSKGIVKIKKDPHTWTTPRNVEIMAKNIYTTLVSLDPKNQQNYKKNLDIFIQEIQNTNTQIENILKDLKQKRSFMVFHPAWKYFAKEYKLKQIAVEIDGKKPKPKEVISVIKEAKKEDVQVIFTQPEFSDKSAKVIAKESNIEVKKISPLNPDWSQNLIYMAKSIAKR